MSATFDAASMPAASTVRRCTTCTLCTPAANDAGTVTWIRPSPIRGRIGCDVDVVELPGDPCLTAMGRGSSTDCRCTCPQQHVRHFTIDSTFSIEQVLQYYPLEIGASKDGVITYSYTIKNGSR